MNHEASNDLRERWDQRYATFSLDELCCLGAGARLNALIYSCKKRAVRRALLAAGVRSCDRFSVLDMGCGWGLFADFYRQEFPRARYVGVDISPRAVEHARHTRPWGEFHADDAVSWRHPLNARFDIVQAIDVLQLLVDDTAFTAALRNLVGHLAEGGALVIPVAFSERPSSNLNHRIRPRGFFDNVVTNLELRVDAEFPMYYWLVDGGPENRLLRALFARTGPVPLYLIDRLALGAGLTNRNPNQVLSTARMMVIRRRLADAIDHPKEASED